MKRTLTLIFALMVWGGLWAQHEPIQPYEELGIKVKVLTLSNGKYQESFPNDTLQRIGSVMFNRVTGEVVSMVERDTLYGEYDLRPEVSSRWISPDPLAEKFPGWSPYNYTYNNPVMYVDPDGKEGVLSVNAESQRLTINAVYFVNAGTNGFSKESYEQFKGINTTLNNQGHTVNDENSPYNGFSVVYNLQFVPVGGATTAQGFATAEAELMANNANSRITLIMNGHNIANSIITMGDMEFNALPGAIEAAEANNVDISRIGGLTSENGQHIVLPSRRQNSELNKIHEIFHTLYFDRDGATDGIGSGKELPNQNEVNLLINGFIKNNRVVNEN